MNAVRSVMVLALVLLTGCAASPPTPTPSPTASTPAASMPTESMPTESTPASTEASVSPEPSGDPDASVGPDASVDAGPSADPSPGPSDAAPADSPDATPIDTTGWTAYASSRYGFRIGHPPDWIVTPAEQSWTIHPDVGAVNSDGHEVFISPAGDVWVNAWAVPFAAEPSLEAVLGWVEEYCRESFSSDCSTIGERAERLCYAHDGCNPGLLVPFATDVQAFFTGGEHQQRVVVVAVWRPPDHEVPGVGTARQILDAFLSTMDVWS